LNQRPDYAPALLNLAIVSQFYLNNPRLALEKYREYLALPDRPSVAPACEAMARELEAELNLPPRPAGTIVSASPGGNDAGSIATATNRVRVSSGGVSTTNVSRIASAMGSPDQKKDSAGIKVESASKSSESTVAGSPAEQPAPSGKPAPTPSPPKSPKPGFFARINPLNWFRHDSEAGSSSTSPSQTNVASSSIGSTVHSAPEFQHYQYQSPAKPSAGDEAAGNRAFQRGLAAQKANHLPEAIQSYAQATQLNPADFDAFYNLGSAATAAGNLSQALLAYEYALAIRPESSDARYNFALVLKQAKYPEDAANQLERLLSFYPNEARAHLALGNLFAQQLQQPVKAREHYTKVLESDPRNSQAAAIRNWMSRNPP
jgi:Tfp pilus assembly protein PilF